jgi:prepilin-type N-terminal cleavage/methylation domain-containing protein
MKLNKMAFTLIELLVVVLIIGILAGIALPIYNKTIWRTRIAELQQMLSAFQKAEQVYFLVHGHYTSRLSDLDISLDSLPLKPAASVSGFYVASTDAVRANDIFEIGISYNNDDEIYLNAYFTKGPYKDGGFCYALRSKTYEVQTGSMYCCEAPAMAAGDFCRKIMNAVFSKNAYTNWKVYAP